MSGPDLRPFSWRHGRLRPEDWGPGMTLCIAALSRRDEMFITVSDMMLSTEWTSAETLATKLNPVGPKNRWLCMFSGSPTVRHKAVIERLARCLAPEGDDTAAGVAAGLEVAFRETLKEKIEGELLSRFGLDRETFFRR